MTCDTLTKARLRIAGLGLATVGLAALAVMPAKAQTYDPYYPDEGYTVGEIVVTPRLGRSAIGAPIRQVSTSR